MAQRMGNQRACSAWCRFIRPVAGEALALRPA
jgi:hypothetical protein